MTSTRRLFDDRGTRSANIDDIAKSVGINRAIIYRHFASKEELFALTLADYLLELDEQLAVADDPTTTPIERLDAVHEVFARYCLRYPAFVDCALALLGRRGSDLLDEISEASLMQLSGLMAGELGRLAAIVRDARLAATVDDAVAGTFAGGGEAPVGYFDLDLLSNALYMQVLGVMHLARSGFMVRPTGSGGGRSGWVGVDQEQIIRLVVQMGRRVAFPPTDA